MILIFLGMPGSGKGTQAQLLAQHHNFVQLSTGDLIRHEISGKTPRGLAIQNLVEAGEYVPDEIILELVESNLLRGVKYIFDGFPRTLNQAVMLDKILKERGMPVSRVIQFAIDDKTVSERLSSRLTCMKCNHVYNRMTSPPVKEGVCDECGSTELKLRKDDQPQSIAKRLKVYEEQAKPLEDYYISQGLLISLDASLPAQTVGQQLESLVLDRNV